MENSLESIVKDCLSRGIPVVKTASFDSGVVYEVQGFSKSGIAKIYVDREKIICETRYQNLEEIYSFNDLAMVALEWYLKYKEIAQFEEPEPYWAEYWVEKGIMSKSTITVYKIN